MKKKTQNRIRNIHLLPNADAQEVRERTGYQRRRRHPGRQLLLRLAIIAAALFVLFLIWNNWEKIAPESVLDWAESQFGEGEVGEGYPYTISGNTVVGMGQTNNHLAVLTESSVKFLNTTAGCVVERPHTFSDPSFKTVGKYALITEMGGARFQLETRRETVLTVDLENRSIYASDVISTGTVAVATDSASQNYLCGIQVYNSRGRIIYEYNTGKYLITNLALAPNGRALAAVGTYAEGGTLKSVLLLFNFSEETPTEFSGTDILLYDVAYFGSGKVLAVGDTAYWVADAHENTVEKIGYDGMELMGYAASRTTAGLVMRQSGSTGSGEVWLFDSSGTISKTHRFAGTFRHAACRDTQFLLLTDETLFVVGGKADGTQMNAPSDGLLAAEYRGSFMLLTLNELRQLTS
ncbi:MAG: hypothetical protein IKA63_00725 [Clostridia bacterium]|nr:hypothetical protein [Clostridia bacterium]